MSLRAVWVRLRSLAPDSPLHAALAEAEAAQEAEAERNVVEDVLSRYQRGQS